MCFNNCDSGEDFKNELKRHTLLSASIRNTHEGSEFCLFYGKKSRRRKCKQLLPIELPISWHLTQQLLVKARVLFTHEYTSAVHKHSETHSVIPAHTQLNCWER